MFKSKIRGIFFDDEQISEPEYKWSLEDLDEPLRTRAVTLINNINNSDALIASLAKDIAEGDNYYHDVAEQLFLTIENGLTDELELGFHTMIDGLKNPHGASIFLTDFKIRNNGDKISFKNIWNSYVLSFPKSLVLDGNSLSVTFDVLLKTLTEIYKQYPVGGSDKVNLTIGIKKYLEKSDKQDPEEVSSVKKKVLDILRMFITKRIEFQQ